MGKHNCTHFTSNTNRVVIERKTLETLEKDSGSVREPVPGTQGGEGLMTS